MIGSCSHYSIELHVWHFNKVLLCFKTSKPSSGLVHNTMSGREISYRIIQLEISATTFNCNTHWLICHCLFQCRLIIFRNIFIRIDWNNFGIFLQAQTSIRNHLLEWINISLSALISSCFSFILKTKEGSPCTCHIYHHDQGRDSHLQCQCHHCWWWIQKRNP